MAKITTTYDSTLKEKAFIVKGEEAYARTTDCVLTELFTNNGERQTDWNHSLDNMKLEFRIDVLRDVGASQVVLYDNDITLGVFDLDTNSHRIDLKYEGGDEDNRIELAYDIEHHLYAKYMGNKQCLKSQSQSYHLFEPMPDAYNCSLSLVKSDGSTPLDINYDTGDSVEFKVKMTAETEVGQEYVAGNNIEIYVDGIKLGDGYTTGIGGITSLIEVDDLDDGKHTITARFNGTDYLAFSSASMDVSMGYLVTIESSPSYVINGSPSDITAKVVDYLNTPQYSFIVFIGEEDAWDPLTQGVPTDRYGLAEFDRVYLSDRPFFARAIHSSVSYQSVDYTTNVYDNVTVDVSPKQAITSTNNVLPISATLKQGTAPLLSDGIAVDFNGSSILTNANGIATYNYEGNSAGDVTVTASVYSAYDTANIEDVYQYWSKVNGSLGIDYSDKRGQTTSQSNGWKCTPDSYFDIYYCSKMMLPYHIILYPTEFEFKVKDVNGFRGFGNPNATRPIFETSVRSGDVIQIIYDNHNHVTYITPRGSHTMPYGESFLGLHFNFTTTSGYLTFDELKIKRY